MTHFPGLIRLPSEASKGSRIRSPVMGHRKRCSKFSNEESAISIPLNESDSMNCCRPKVNFEFGKVLRTFLVTALYVVQEEIQAKIQLCLVDSRTDKVEIGPNFNRSQKKSRK